MLSAPAQPPVQLLAAASPPVAGSLVPPGQSGSVPSPAPPPPAQLHAPGQGENRFTACTCAYAICRGRRCPYPARYMTGADEQLCLACRAPSARYPWCGCHCEACGDPPPQHRWPVAGCDTAASSASGSGAPAAAFALGSAEPLQGSGGGSVLGATQPASHNFSYPGSRRRRARYACGGFIELSPAASAGRPEMVVNAFRQSLTAVRGVDRVELHPKGSKTQQGIHGKHYQDHNFAVFSSKNPKVFIEFQLTRHQHMDKEPFTVTAMYKNPIKALIPEAWRILRIACQGKELLPDWVNEMEKKLLDNWRQSMHDPMVHQGPGSASPEGESNTEPVLDAPFLDDDTNEIEWLMKKTADPLPIPHGRSVRWQGDESGAAPDEETSDPDSPITAGPYPGSSASTAVGVLIPQQARDNLAQFTYALEHGLVPPPRLYEIPNIIDDVEDTEQVD